MSELTLTSTGVRFLYLPVRSVDPTTGDDVDLSSAVLKAALVRPNDRPDTADWVAADNAGDALIAGQSYTLARVLVGTGGTIVPRPGAHVAWVRVELGQEVIEEDCGRVRVL